MYPLLSRYNAITWRFVPGLILGALLQAWFQAAKTPVWNSSVFH
jgi:uncharacterized membrane protein